MVLTVSQSQPSARLLIQVAEGILEFNVALFNFFFHISNRVYVDQATLHLNIAQTQLCLLLDRK